MHRDTAINHAAYQRRVGIAGNNQPHTTHHQLNGPADIAPGLKKTTQ